MQYVLERKISYIIIPNIIYMAHNWIYGKTWLERAEVFSHIGAYSC